MPATGGARRAQQVLVVVGPTASGKTALTCELAERLGAEIVNADSQQCYRGLDRVTAKPTAQEQARARHHLLDVADPEEQLDAAAFVRMADAALREIAARGRRAIVAGGTGLWIRALLNGLVDAPAADPAFRAALRAELEERGAEALHARLAAVDPASAARIRASDRVRVERALEVHALSGKSLSELHRAHAFAERRYQAKLVFLDPPRALLAERIAARTRELFTSGALERETRWLLDRIGRVPAAAKALKIIGYGESAQWLQAGATAESAEVLLQRIAARTRQYAKRQRTWFSKEARPAAWPLDAMHLCEDAGRWYEAAQ